MLYFKKIIFALSLVLASAFAFAAPVDVNTADAETLASALVGIGQKKAEAIVSYRQINGPFQAIEDLAKVKGIGEKTIEKNRENLTVMK
jgi:competence protein ComEA